MLTLTIFALSVMGHPTSDVAATRVFSTKAAAAAFCSGYTCAANELTSQWSGWMCPQFQSTNPSTHQHVLCSYQGTWTRTPAAPSDCDFGNQYQCQKASNNCWNSPSNSCDTWCRCYNHNALGSSDTATRLGYGLGGAAQSNEDQSNEELGHSASSVCPWWLPFMHGLPNGWQHCWNKGYLCKYPKYGKNFVCSGYNGVWKLQGAPTPRPTPAPVTPSCPSIRSIWDGDASCSHNGFLCKYPSQHINYVCTNGVWKPQGGPPPTPRPTPAPVNSVECPPASHYLKDGAYCTTKGQRCDYPNGEKWLCCNKGVWNLLMDK